MKHGALGLLVVSSVVALLATGCPGPKPAAAPSPGGAAADAPRGPLVWKVSKSGLGFRLSNADEDGDTDPQRKVTPSTPLGKGDTDKIVGRLPRLEQDPDDAKTDPSGNSGARIACGVVERG